MHYQLEWVQAPPVGIYSQVFLACRQATVDRGRHSFFFSQQTAIRRFLFLFFIFFYFLQSFEKDDQFDQEQKGWKPSPPATGESEGWQGE